MNSYARNVETNLPSLYKVEYFDKFILSLIQSTYNTLNNFVFCSMVCLQYYHLDIQEIVIFFIKSTGRILPPKEGSSTVNNLFEKILQ